MNKNLKNKNKKSIKVKNKYKNNKRYKNNKWWLCQFKK